jgi:hypothetical protein
LERHRAGRHRAGPGWPGCSRRSRPGPAPAGGARRILDRLFLLPARGSGRYRVGSSGGIELVAAGRAGSMPSTETTSTLPGHLDVSTGGAFRCSLERVCDCI